MSQKTETQRMIEDLQAAEAVLAVLDQNATTHGEALTRLFGEQYRAVLKLRDQELRAWNDEASCGPNDARRTLYRCGQAESPYHMPAEDGPCEIYTPNWHAGVSICDTCRQNAK